MWVLLDQFGWFVAMVRRNFAGLLEETVPYSKGCGWRALGNDGRAARIAAEKAHVVGLHALRMGTGFFFVQAACLNTLLVNLFPALWVVRAGKRAISF